MDDDQLRALVEELTADRTPVTAAGRWLLVQAAPVILSDKAGELLHATAADFKLDHHALPRVLERWVGAFDRELIVLHEGDGANEDLAASVPRSRQILVFDGTAQATAVGAIPADTLRRLGYPEPASAAAFVEELRQRWANTGATPHEVGFLLGYPTTDVVTYLSEAGCPALEAATRDCGWRVYGDEAEARARGERWAAARHRARQFIAAGFDAATRRRIATERAAAAEAATRQRRGVLGWLRRMTRRR